MSDSKINRRRFLAGSAAAVASTRLAASAAERVVGANDRIAVGVIGCGRRAGALMKEVHDFSKECNAEIVAVCDVWRQRREKAAAKVSVWYESKPKSFVRWQEVIALDDVDAVIIAAPDHHHATMLKAAVLAGKDVYCEKPWAIELDELNEAVDAVKKTKRVVQAGTQLRSRPSFTGCRELVKTGALGTISKIEQCRNGTRPYWHGRSEPLREADVDWKAFLGNRPYRPFDARQFTDWYGFREFSTGPIGGLMCHFTDLVHYVTGAKFPRSAVSHGGIYYWKDGHTNPDTIATLLEYPDDGFLVSYSTNFGNGTGSYTRFLGSKGTLDTSNWNKPKVSGAGASDPKSIKGDKPVDPVERAAHMQDWLQCIRSRKQPNADVDAGYQHAITSILSDTAWVKGRRMVFDPKKREILPG